MTSSPQRLRFALLALLGLMPAIARAQEPPRGADAFDPAKLAQIETLLADAVKSEEVAGASGLILVRGERAALFVAGDADREAHRPMAEDTIVRIASMSKPITSVAVMVLVDDGKLNLDDPVSKFIPEFADLKFIPPTGSGGAPEPSSTPMTVHHLLTHTSGLTYRFMGTPGVSQTYAAYNVSDGLVETPGTIGDNMVRLAQAPLLFEPGSAWNYSLSTDVLGRVVEVASGQDFDDFLEERVFGPLKMADTQFIVPVEKRDRLAAVYGAGADGKVARIDDRHPIQNGPLVYSSTYPTWDTGHYFSGGAGLTSTLGDYGRFLQMLLNRGELDGVRLLEPETVDLMTSNRIGDLPLPGFGHGDRFGYGFGITGDPPAEGNPFPTGTYSWGGFFSTDFWVDPSNGLLGILFTQTYPAGNLNLDDRFRSATYDALLRPTATPRENR